MSDQNSTTPDPSDAVPGYQPPSPAEPPAAPSPPSYTPPAAQPPAYSPPAYEPPATPPSYSQPTYPPPAPATGGYEPPAAPYTPPSAPAGGYSEPAGAYPPAYSQPGYGQEPAGYPPPGYPAAPIVPATGGQLVDWGKRAMGGLIDYVAPIIVFAVVAGIIGNISSSLGNVVNALLGIGWMLYLGYKSGTTGITLGRSIAKTKLISAETGQPIGVTNGIIRQFAHIIDSIICYVGWLFPLWDAQKQTIADKIMKTVVIDNSADPNASNYQWQ